MRSRIDSAGSGGKVGIVPGGANRFHQPLRAYFGWIVTNRCALRYEVYRRVLDAGRRYECALNARLTRSAGHARHRKRNRCFARSLPVFFELSRHDTLLYRLAPLQSTYPPPLCQATPSAGSPSGERILRCRAPIPVAPDRTMSPLGEFSFSDTEPAD